LYEISYIFCNDEYLRKLNRKYLKNNNLTDVIAFNYAESDTIVFGEIYISTERVKENANKFKVLYIEEMKRMMIHGTLHLLGFEDKKSDEKNNMRRLEEEYLKLFIALKNVSRETIL